MSCLKPNPFITLYGFFFNFPFPMSGLNNQFGRMSCCDGFGNLLRIPPSFYSFITMQCRNIMIPSFFQIKGHVCLFFCLVWVKEKKKKKKNNNNNIYIIYLFTYDQKLTRVIFTNDNFDEKYRDLNLMKIWTSV